MNLDGRIFVKRLKLVVTTYQLSYRSLAEYMNLAYGPDHLISHSAISKWSSLKRLPNMLYVVALCSIFGISTDWILGISSEPYTLDSISLQERIGKKVDDDIRRVLGYEFRRDGPWDLASAAEALFIFNFLCLQARKLGDKNKDLSASDIWSILFLSNQNMLERKTLLGRIIKTNKPQFNLREAIRNEKRCS